MPVIHITDEVSTGVIGPGSSTPDAIVLFADGTGQVLKNGTVTNIGANALEELSDIISAGGFVKLFDSQGNEILTCVGSTFLTMVNHVELNAAPTGIGCLIRPIGETNISLEVRAKGNEHLNLRGGNTGHTKVILGNFHITLGQLIFEVASSIKFNSTPVLSILSAILIRSDVAHEFNKVAYFAVKDHGTTGGTIVIDATTTSLKHSITLNAATTFNFTTHLGSNKRADWVFDVWNHSTPTTLAFQKDGSSTNILWPGGVAKVLTNAAGAKDTYRVHWNGTAYEITSAQNFS